MTDKPALLPYNIENINGYLKVIGVPLRHRREVMKRVEFARTPDPLLKEMAEALTLAQAIIGRPDDERSKIIAATLKKYKQMEG